MLEQILSNLYVFENEGSIALLCYFNLVGKLEKSRILGNDYETPDSTGFRDYIHVVELVLDHIKSLDKVHTDKGFNS